MPDQTASEDLRLCPSRGYKRSECTLKLGSDALLANIHKYFTYCMLSQRDVEKSFFFINLSHVAPCGPVAVLDDKHNGG